MLVAETHSWYVTMFTEPAHVVQWSNHLGSMCSRAWHTQWPWSGVQSELRPGKACPPTKK